MVALDGPAGVVEALRVLIVVEPTGVAVVVVVVVLVVVVVAGVL
jgi:hypothetical protein